MKQRHPFIAFSAVALAAALLACTIASASADEAKPKALALRKIMQDMGKSMQGITDAISREDWAMVAKVAPLIGGHQQPPMAEKMRILGFIGSEAGTFKRHDEQVQQSAKALQQAAARGDGQAVISSFAALQGSCLACHQKFRQQVVEHFYEKR